MAELTDVPMKLELPSKTAQELLKNIVEEDMIPERYTYVPDDHSEASDESVVSYMDTNIIDFGLLEASSSPQGAQELVKLRSFLNSWGCFQLTNHGLTSLMEQVREVAKQFFELPLEEKQKYSKTFDSIQGYGNDVFSEAIPINWNDRLHLLVHPVDHRNLKFWPENVPNFRVTLDKYMVEIKKVHEKILRSVAKSLILEETRFVEHCGEMTVFARFNYYPPCPYPERVVGLRRHSDPSVLTILLPDREVEGLRVINDNKWFKVPILPDALFVNVGDLLEIMSNGAVKSVEHKAVINKNSERLSVGLSCGADLSKEIGPLPELTDNERLPLYQNVKNYVSIFFSNIGRGIRPIDTVKI